MEPVADVTLADGSDAALAAMPVEKAKRVLSEAQLEILKKAREKAVEARRQKADASKAVRSLKDKQAELERLRVVRETEELEKQLAAAKEPEAPASPRREKPTRQKRRPNAPVAKRRQVVSHAEDDMDEDDEWHEWEEPQPKPVQPPPRHAVPYARVAPHSSVFDPAHLMAKQAYLSEIERMKGRLVYESVWGRR